MRSKLYLGLFVVGVAGIAAGDYVFHRLAHAQDAPKKVEPEAKKSELFDALKKSLEAAKKEAVPPPVEVTIPPPAAPTATNKDEKTPPPIAPPALQPLAPPPVIAQPEALTKPVIPPPSVGPKPPVATPQSLDFPPLKPATNDPKPPAVDVKPSVPSAFDPPAKPVIRTKPSVPQENNDSAQATKPTPQKDPVQSVDEGKASSPWSLHVEMLDGQTIITATVNNKHELRIVCQSLDLQTGKGTLMATGKVQISGDMLTGNCERLTIALREDRLSLEGPALLTINKAAGSAKSAAFELKGEKLDLRISEMQSAKVVQGDLQTGIVRTVSRKADGKQWSPYGQLRPAKLDLGGETAWRLVNAAGKEILYIVPREGGSLRQYEGQTVSVFGTNESVNGRDVIRVTHIALP